MVNLIFFIIETESANNLLDFISTANVLRKTEKKFESLSSAVPILIELIERHHRQSLR